MESKFWKVREDSFTDYNLLVAHILYGLFILQGSEKSAASGLVELLPEGLGHI